MAKVYVIWYGKVLEGELLDGDYLGMKQVVIPLDGHRPIALFTPEHVYQSPEEIAKDVYSYSKSFPTPETIITKDPFTKLIDVMPDDDRDMIENFKRENWDAEHNHLCIDKLDEFYQLWRLVMKPFGYVEAEAPVTLSSHNEESVIAEAPKRIVSDERMEELKKQLKTKLDPKPKKPSKKMLRSTGQLQFNDATQLALFD